MASFQGAMDRTLSQNEHLSRRSLWITFYCTGSSSPLIPAACTAICCCCWLITVTAVMSTAARAKTVTRSITTMWAPDTGWHVAHSTGWLKACFAIRRLEEAFFFGGIRFIYLSPVYQKCVHGVVDIFDTRSAHPVPTFHVTIARMIPCSSTSPTKIGADVSRDVIISCSTIVADSAQRPVAAADVWST